MDYHLESVAHEVLCKDGREITIFEINLVLNQVMDGENRREIKCKKTNQLAG